MIKAFVGSTYDIRHETINEKNAEEVLKDDIRSKLLGSSSKFVYAERSLLKNNSNIQYIGGFYYEKIPSDFISHNSCDYIVEAELRQIDEADIVIIILMNYSAIATITELLYAAYKKKKIIIFCNPKITKFEVEGEYWFPIIAVERKNKENTKLIFTEDKNEIINYINSIEDI